MEVLHSAPPTSTFIPLAEHQSTTPASFYAGPPVLHYHSARCKVIILEGDLGVSQVLGDFVTEAGSTNNVGGVNGNGAAVAAGDDDKGDEQGAQTEEHEENGQRVVEEVDVWVTSENLLLYKPSTSIGLSIPYRSIALHAIQSLPRPDPSEQQAVYMQIMSSAEGDEEMDSVSLTIVPTAAEPTTTATSTTRESVDDDQTQPTQSRNQTTPVQSIFTALSDCSNLHPDPTDDEEMDGIAGGLAGSRLYHAGMLTGGDSDGGLPPPMPGSGGWITAENMHEFVDENGDWVDDEAGQDGEGEGDADVLVGSGDEQRSLGPGAGTVRGREEEDGDGDGKWQRTS